MIAKAPTQPRKKRVREPLDVRLTFKINYGDTPEESVTVMNDRRVPMLRVGLAQPKVVREVFPPVRLLRKLTKSKA